MSAATHSTTHLMNSNLIGLVLTWYDCLFLIHIVGVKYIPLRTTGGELIPESGLFVRIKLSENIWQPPSRSPKHLAKNASKEGLETISEIDDIDVTASLYPVTLKKYLPRQSEEIEENPLSDEDEGYEDHSFARRTLSSPPSITTDRANAMRKKTPSPDNKVANVSQCSELAYVVWPTFWPYNLRGGQVSGGRINLEGWSGFKG